MFSLHEMTKVRLCRGAFFAFCVLPTCAVLLWSIMLALPSYRRAHEKAISTRLGWHATLKRASTPRPGVLLYEWLELTDPDTGQLLARLPFVEIDDSDETLIVRLPYPAIVNGTRLDAFWKLMQDQARPIHAGRRVRFETQNLTLHLVDHQHRDAPQSFTEVHGLIECATEQSRAKLTFRRAIAGNEGADPGEITVTRTHDATSPTNVTTTSSITASTGSTPLPPSVVAAIWPGVAMLGRSCEFEGRVTATEQAGDWRCQLQGHFSGIDLDRLVSQQFPHKLSGLADLRLKSVMIQNGRVESAAGRLTAGPGEISRSLIQSADTHLHIQASSAAMKGASNQLAYKQLGLSFDIGPQGLTVHGEVPGARGALLVDKSKVLALEPPVVSQPVLDLVRTLVPHSEMMVPATQETVGLANTLPVPSIVPVPGSEAPLPSARTIGVKPSRDEWKPRR